MKKFDIPDHFRSPIISKIKADRKLADPRKKDFSPTILEINNLRIIIARHFGFCFGVENAVEIAYKTVLNNPNRNIYLLSEMIHNPLVNKDLKEIGVQFIQDTSGNQLISWDDIKSDDIVLIPAFGAPLETMKLLEDKGINTDKYNTTCPFVEKVWNRSAGLGEEEFTVIIHGKYEHEETKATFSHAAKNGHAIIVRDMKEAQLISDFICGNSSSDELLKFFSNKCSDGFDPIRDLVKIGVVNQTTMLASETKEIMELFREAISKRYGKMQLQDHFANTRDTLCYATNDNQTATLELLKENADMAIVVGGHNSSNTGHLVELLESKFKTYFVRNADDFDQNKILSFDLSEQKIIETTDFLPTKKEMSIIITSGASCPDAIVDDVIKKLLVINNLDPAKVLNQ